MSTPDSNGWMPIESAPKDGTSVMVWFCGKILVAQYSAVWHPDNLKWIVVEPITRPNTPRMIVDLSPPEVNGIPIPKEYGGHDGPTHWQPLPKPPVSP